MAHDRPAILDRHSPDEIPADFEPYTPAEVQALRKQPLVDVIGERARLMAELEQQP